MDHPVVWARGKTLDEVVNLGQGLNSALAKYVEQGGQPAPPAPRPQPQTFDREAMVTGADLERFGPQLVRDAVGNDVNAAMSMAADANLDIVRREFASEYAKYGPTINAVLAQVPVQQRTVDNLRKTFRYALADHHDEIVRDKAARLVAEMPVETLRSNGAPLPAANASPSHSLDSESTPEYFKRMATEVGLTDRAVDEYCRANDMTREQFYDQFKKPGIITEFSFKRGGSTA